MLDAPPQQILRKDRGTGQILGDLREGKGSPHSGIQKTHDGRELRMVAQLPTARGQDHCHSFPCLLRRQYHYTYMLICVHTLINTCAPSHPLTCTTMYVCTHTHTINIGEHTSSHRQTPLFPHTPAHTSPQPYPETPELEFTDLHTHAESSCLQGPTSQLHPQLIFKAFSWLTSEK